MGLERGGYWSEGTVGEAVHEGEPLTVEEIKALPEGAEVVVTWSGGNGPHRYRVAYEMGWPGVMAPGDLSVSLLLSSWEQRIPLHRVTRVVASGDKQEPAA